MATPNSILCGNCGILLIPSGGNGKYRKTQRYCSPKCARKQQVPVVKSPYERIWKHVRKTDGCWLWEGSRQSNGYGHMNCGSGRTRPAHVIAYESIKGPVPEGLVLDHLCRTPLCVNPSHLEAVTQKENVLRSHMPNILLHHQGVCKRGHKVCEENTYFYIRGPRQGRVAYCRVCEREKKRLQESAKVTSQSK